jgi:hypothetical protein
MVSPSAADIGDAKAAARAKATTATTDLRRCVAIMAAGQEDGARRLRERIGTWTQQGRIDRRQSCVSPDRSGAPIGIGYEALESLRIVRWSDPKERRPLRP